MYISVDVVSRVVVIGRRGRTKVYHRISFASLGRLASLFSNVTPTATGWRKIAA